jgi:hypothetical protein
MTFKIDRATWFDKPEVRAREGWAVISATEELSGSPGRVKVRNHLTNREHDFGYKEGLPAGVRELQRLSLSRAEFMGTAYTSLSIVTALQTKGYYVHTSTFDHAAALVHARALARDPKQAWDVCPSTSHTQTRTGRMSLKLPERGRPGATDARQGPLLDLVRDLSASIGFTFVRRLLIWETAKSKGQVLHARNNKGTVVVHVSLGEPGTVRVKTPSGQVEHVRGEVVIVRGDCYQAHEQSTAERFALELHAKEPEAWTPHVFDATDNRQVAARAAVRYREGTCACEDGCRMCPKRKLNEECTRDNCADFDRCTNCPITKKQTKDTEIIQTSDGRGSGLRLSPRGGGAKQGEFIIEFKGVKVKCLPLDATYILHFNGKLYDLRGRLCGLVNHHCEPNCRLEPRSVGDDERLGLFALRDIEPGEELTFDYRPWGNDELLFKCLCR